MWWWMTGPACPTSRSWLTRRGRPLWGFPSRAVGRVQRQGHRVPHGAQGPGPCLRLQGICQGLPHPGPPAHPHQVLHAQDQRQGREVYPDAAGGMGLRDALQHLNGSLSCRDEQPVGKAHLVQQLDDILIDSLH